MRRPRIVAAVACIVAAVVLHPAAARASPREPQPLRERYEPGETATVVGYTRWRGPLDGYLVANPCRRVAGHCIPASEVESLDLLVGPIPVGRFVVEETAHEARGLRLALTFTVPADLSPGTYFIATCRRGGACRLGDRLHVGIDPPSGDRTVYHWPLDDPAIADLPDDALLLGHDGEEVTAAEVRAGITRHATERGSVRTDTPDGGTDGSLPPVLWLLGGTLLVLGWWAVARLGSGRKHVRRS
jgi:hypothetical protein